MHFLLYTLAATLAGTAASLSLPLYPSILRLPSISNGSLQALDPLNTINTLLGTWPKPPFHVLISETKTHGILESTWMIINNYLSVQDPSLKGAITGNISLLVELIDSYNPDDLIDNRRVLTSGLVSVRFPAVQARNAQRMTNALAVELLGAAWQLEYARGPMGWASATIKTVRGKGDYKVVGFFSLWISEKGPVKGTSAS